MKTCQISGDFSVDTFADETRVYGIINIAGNGIKEEDLIIIKEEFGNLVAEYLIDKE